MQNETNCQSVFWEYFYLKAQIITIFTFLIIPNFKTDIYLNNFQEHLLRFLRYLALLKNREDLTNWLTRVVIKKFMFHYKY